MKGKRWSVCEGKEVGVCVKGKGWSVCEGKGVEGEKIFNSQMTSYTLVLTYLCEL